VRQSLCSVDDNHFAAWIACQPVLAALSPPSI
jgi:hypothetical protein